ncbi:MAG: T9SS type A sorting domain-containing protein [Saprospiraceae bacterium]|nr:T9SS type A sorting domain-containing protein [Saprospiraceae bacterium]
MRRQLRQLQYTFLLFISSLHLFLLNAQTPVISFAGPGGESYIENSPICISVLITNPLSVPTSVDILIDAGTTATYGTDFTIEPTTLVFPADFSGYQYVCIGVTDDTEFEPVEYISLKLANATNGATITNGTNSYAFYDNDSISMTFPCQQPFISEYLHSLVDGSSRALEIYNPTLSNVSLNGYNVRIFHNGASDPTLSIPLDGLLTPGATFVVAHSESAPLVQAQADLLTPLLNFTGDDAVGLFQGDILVDVIGVIGQDPGLYWPAGYVQTASADLVRNAVVRQGETSWYISAGHWTGSDQSQYANLGSHTMFPCSPDGSFPPLINMVTLDATFDENIGGLGIQAALYYPKNVETTVEVTVGSGTTATPGLDFMIEPSTLVFPANFTGTQGIGITIFNDLIAEPTETLVITLKDPTNGGVLLDSVWVLTLVDDDFSSNVEDFDVANTQNLLIAPNPAIAGSDLLVDGLGAEILGLSLYDLSGAWAKRFGSFDNKGDQSVWQIDLPANTPAGLYLLHARTPNGLVIRKLIIEQ